MVRETAFDEVFDSQATFRVLLDSLSRPGTIRILPLRPYESAPAGFCPPALSILKTMCDHRVSFSVGSSGLRPDWVSYLSMNLATPFRHVDVADYVLFEGERFDADFTRLNRGTPEFPEFSATALLCVGRLSEEGDPGRAGYALRLSGPGVKDAAILSVTGLDPRYLEERSKANMFYPMGIDLLLVDKDGRVAGIPRTSSAEPA
ncbi:MAG: phosphonate C-P lyase system protein PhnH [Spirochaetia bacterium]|jgi:alpha-D-ribose 1-methylphosphonate 5-triphosphate synthase subunit PhnH